MTNMRSISKASGFTLIELGAVMVIIGLLSTGMVYGYRVYEETEVKSVYSTVQTVTQAYKQFVGRYNAQPGDMIDATTRIKGCTGKCINGNGDNFTGAQLANINDNFSPTSTADQENVQFWYHLQRAGLINLVNPATDSTTVAAGAFGKTVPEVMPHGGLVMRVINKDVCIQSTGQAADLTGVWLVWQGKPTQAEPVVDTHYAQMLDKKYDDGQPGYGNIRAGGAGATDINDGCRTDLKTYKSAGTGKCYMYFRISRNIN